MNCQQTERWILLMHSGELPLKKRLRLERHVSNCPQCRIYQDQLDRIMKAAEQALPAGEPNATVISAIREEARSFVRKNETQVMRYSTHPVFMKWRPVLACAALVLICVVGWYILAGRQQFHNRVAESRPPARDVSNEIKESMNNLYTLSIISANDIVYFEQLSDLAQQQNLSLVDKELMILEGLAI